MGKSVPASGKCRELYGMFLLMFPHFKDTVEFYGPLDRSAIRVRLYNHKSFIFEYVNENDWSLDTEKHYFRKKQAFA